MTLTLARPLVERTTAPATDHVAVHADVDDLVRIHLPLVGHLVREALTRLPAHVRRDDLVSAGMLALATCAKTYDPTQNVTFAAYASFRIRGALTDELRSMDWATRSARSRSRDLEAAREALTQTLHRTPTTSETAAATGLSAREIGSIEADNRRAGVLSLHAVVAEDHDTLLPEAAGDGPESLLLRREQLGYLRDAIAELPERLAQVVVQYFLEQRRMCDIAEDLGVTESRVSQMRGEALAMLRVALQCAADGVTHEGTGRKADGLRAYAHAVANRSSVTARLGMPAPIAV